MPLRLATIGKSIVAVAMLAAALVIAIASRGGDDPAAAVRSLALTPNPPACADDLIVPVEGIGRDRLANTFDDARSEERRHDAIDIPAPLGTPVLAAATGRVEKLFLSSAGGKTIYVRAPDGRTLYYYAHLDAYAPGLREGETVLQGTRIGAVGFSGNANPAAPHLHFAMMATSPERGWWQASRALNPYVYLSKVDGQKCRKPA